ncbi:GNAT family N-acetyltransferase [Nocardioides sp. Bht2]|uniref:GNAT family N-acetyltransferase n=1 Tax=Nocardioides sp. Bht2 TaxID=3392297 RepID=UPI0039B5D9A9
MLELRIAGADDWQIWREVRLAALAESPGAFGATLADWQGDGDKVERWRARLSIPGARDLIAYLDGHPVGMASGVPGEVPETIELISMWVAPSARGHGISDLVIEEIARWSDAQGANRLVLAVKAQNLAAIRAYQRAGFSIVLTAEGVAEPDADGELTMVRPLPRAEA